MLFNLRLFLPDLSLFMSLIVQKYGGTSVGTIERIEAVAARVAAKHQAGNQLVVAVSAMVERQIA